MILLRGGCQKKSPFECDARVRRLYHHQPVDLLGRSKQTWMAEAGPLQQRILIYNFAVAFLGPQLITVSEKWNEHTALNLVVRVLLT